MNAGPILSVQEVCSGYGSTLVLRGISLVLHPGEVLAVLGKNGMGKTTLLKTIMGFIRPAEGKIFMDGRDVSGAPPFRLARTGVAYVPQELNLFQDLTVKENLRLGVASDALFRRRVTSLSKSFPRIIERLPQRAGTLSGGEQKMLVMSRAMLARPRVMLLDEISEGLQPAMVRNVADQIRHFRRNEGAAILLVEQNLDLALSVADRFGVLKLGEIVEEGSTLGDAAGSKLAKHLAV